MAFYETQGGRVKTEILLDYLDTHAQVPTEDRSKTLFGSRVSNDADQREKLPFFYRGKRIDPYSKKAVLQALE